MAVKKSAKKAAKKAPAKKAVAKKRIVKKSVAKKTAKRPTAKKAVAKKATTKKAVAKKSAVKKKVVKKAPAKRVVKKSAVAVTSSPAAAVARPAAPALPAKPVAAPKQSTSGRAVWLVAIGIAALAIIVWSTSANNSTEEAAPTPVASESAEPTESATPTEPTEPAEPGAVVSVVEAPSKFVALASDGGLKLRWVAPMAMDGLTGYNVETRANGTGEWTVVATLPVDQLTQNVTKASDSGWTQFRVSSVYSDGQTAPATVFGIPGEFN